MRYLFLLLTFAFTTELEVDGVIKANSGIDANNNPITNVGIPLTMNDAINGNVLQDALRDNGNYEYKMFVVIPEWTTSWSMDFQYFEINGTAGQNYDFVSKLGDLSSQGYMLDRVLPYDAGTFRYIFIVKRLVD